MSVLRDSDGRPLYGQIVRLENGDVGIVTGTQDGLPVVAFVSRDTLKAVVRLMGLDERGSK